MDVLAGNVGVEVDRPRFVVSLTVRLVRASRVSAALAALIGVIVLGGYGLRWKTAVQVYPSLPPMYPNAALAFLVGGASAMAASSSRNRDRLCAVAGFTLVAVYGLVTLGLHLAGAGSTWLEALWPDKSFIHATTRVPGRPVPETCIALACIGVAGALLCARRAVSLAHGLAIGTVAIGMAAILGYLLGVNRSSLGTAFVIVGMALHTAIALTLLGLAVLLAKPTSGLVARLIRGGPTAHLARQLIAAVVAVPILSTATSVAFQRVVPDARLAQSIVAITQVLALGLLVMLLLRAAERFEAAATDALLSARSMTEADAQGRFIADSLTTELTQIPEPPSGWDVGFRQSAAFGQLPGDVCVLVGRADGLSLVSIIDIAGHGPGPAVQALRVKTELVVLWCAGNSLHQIADAINESVLEMSTIASGVLISLDPTSGDCDYINAGHPSVMISHNKLIEEWTTTDMIFGVRSRTVNGPQRRHIDRNSFLMAYTDGITEARSSSGEYLPKDVILRVIQLHASAGAQAMADAAIDTALEHSRKRLQDDALTLVLHRP